MVANTDGWRDGNRKNKRVRESTMGKERKRGQGEKQKGRWLALRLDRILHTESIYIFHFSKHNVQILHYKYKSSIQNSE